MVSEKDLQQVPNALQGEINQVAVALKEYEQCVGRENRIHKAELLFRLLLVSDRLLTNLTFRQTSLDKALELLAFESPEHKEIKDKLDIVLKEFIEKYN